MKATFTGILTLFFLAITVAVADDDKKAKIPKLTFVGNYDGEVVYVDLHSDKLTLKIRGVVPKWVPNNNGGGGGIGALGRVNNRYNQGGGGTYVPEEKVQEISVNLSPDMKVRLVNAPPAAPKEDKPKDGEAKKDGEEKKDDEKTKMEDKKDPAKKDGKPAAKKPSPPRKTKEQQAAELRKNDPDYQLGGFPGKKTMLSKGQLVRVAMGRNNDPVNPQIYGMVVYVVKDSK